MSPQTQELDPDILFKANNRRIILKIRPISETLSHWAVEQSTQARKVSAGAWETETQGSSMAPGSEGYLSTHETS